MSYAICLAWLHRCIATARYCLLPTCALFLIACGGGGGGGGGGGNGTSANSGGGSSSGPTFVGISPGTLQFSTTGPSGSVPDSQTVTATVSGVSGGNLFIKIDIDGQVISSVTYILVISQTQGQATFNPGLPGNLGAGTHTSTVTVSICTTDPACSGAQLAGSPKTINVNYQIGPLPPPDTVVPYVGTSQVPDEVIIRGKGFLTATNVKFGATSGSILAIPSNTEIRARYPALAAGTYAITVNNGAIPFTASLKVVDPPAYASTAIGYPIAAGSIRGLVYDPERKALLLGVENSSDPSNNKVLRYAFSNGSWSAQPSALTSPNLKDVALSIDGTRLLAISGSAISQLNPITLASISTTPKPGLDALEQLSGIAVANDGTVLVTTTLPHVSGNSFLYFYSPLQSTFRTPLYPDESLYRANASASANGHKVAVMQTDISSGPLKFYDTTTALLYETPLYAGGSSLIENMKLDRTGSHMALSRRVYDSSLTSLGLFPAASTAFALSPDGTRIYTIELGGTCRLRAFNLVAAPGGDNDLAELFAGYPISIPCPATPLEVDVRTAISPAGDTLFAAGNSQIVVVHLP